MGCEVAIAKVRAVEAPCKAEGLNPVPYSVIFPAGRRQASWV